MAGDGTEVVDRGTATRDGVLRRLLVARNRAENGAGKAPQLPQPAPMTPARAAATAVGRAAARLYGLGVQPVAVTPGALTLAELPELLPQPALLVVLQGPGDLIGMMALCPETVTALIEIQALGRVTSRQAERRRPTRSDAMICADFVNALMAELASEMAGVEGFDGIGGFRYATWLDDPRPLALMLEDKPYRSLEFKLRLGAAETRDSTIFCALPQSAAVDRASPRIATGHGTGADAAGAEGDCGPQKAVAGMAAEILTSGHERKALASVMQQAPVELVGVLCRRRMSLGELRALTPGKLLHLPRLSLAEARLETRDGQLLAMGKFGEAEGCHAIRVHDAHAGARRAPPPGPGAEIGQDDLSAAIGHRGATGHEPPMEDLAQPDAFRQVGREAGTAPGSSSVVAHAQASKAAGTA